MKTSQPSRSLPCEFVSAASGDVNRVAILDVEICECGACWKLGHEVGIGLDVKVRMGRARDLHLDIGEGVVGVTLAGKRKACECTDPDSDVLALAFLITCSPSAAAQFLRWSLTLVAALVGFLAGLAQDVRNFRP